MRYLCFCAVVAMALVGCEVETRVSPRDLTITSITACKHRIHLFAKAENRLPDSLEELPTRHGYLDSTDDGWGKPLLYQVSSDGTLSIRSLGADFQEGGIGNNQDLEIVMRWRDEDGNFIVKDPNWQVVSQLTNY